MDAMRTGLGNGAKRRGLRWSGGLALMLAAALTAAGAARAQVKVPRYQGPIAAPAPQALPTLPTPQAITPDGTVVEDAVVRVNDQIIDRSDYMRSQQQLLDEARQSNMTAEELAERQKDMLRDMIDQQLLLSRGKELDINADAEVIRQLDEIRKRNKLDAMEEKDCTTATCTSLEKAMRDSGISYEDFKAGIKNSIITQKVIGQEVGQTLRLTTKQEQAYYDQHKQEYEQPEQVRLSEILVPTPDNATDAQVAQAKARAEDVVAKLKAGASFEEMAKQLSAGQTASTGGDLGEFKRGALGSSALEDPVFALEAGGLTAPIRTRQGYVVLKVTEHTQAGIPPLSAVEDQVREAVGQEAMRPALRAYLTGLREKAYIDIAPGFVDTGASPKQTKTVYTTSALPSPKKKEQKARLDQGRAATGSAAGAAAPAKVAAGAASAGAKPVVAGAAADSTAAKTKTVATGKKPKKIHREKIRFGQAPRNSLPASPEEAKAAGADQGAGGAPIVPKDTTIVPIDQTTTVAEDEVPLAPPTARKKTRYSDRAPIEDKARREAKAAKLKEEKAAAATPAPVVAAEKTAQQVQNVPLGLGGDTAAKAKKKKRVKGEAKERLQEQAPAPPKPKPEATPIPPKSVRENGEPLVSPPPAVPAVTPPATDAQPSAPASPAAAK
jgi:peptidyl-prolyl cis-trans isomerase SurA